MLQSVLYFTGDYLRQFWLTPFLNILLDNISLSPNDKIITSLLEKIDNQMSTCDNMNDKEVSFLLLGTDIDIQFDGAVPDDEFIGTVSRSKNISEVLNALEYYKTIHFKVEGRRVTVMQ